MLVVKSGARREAVRRMREPGEDVVYSVCVEKIMGVILRD